MKNRLNGLKRYFNVISIRETKKIENFYKKLVLGNDDEFILIKKSDSNNCESDFVLSETVFNNIIKYDPTSNNQYSQWMLECFIRLIKYKFYDDAIRYYREDLPQIKNALLVFDNNKRKKRFHRWVSNLFHKSWKLNYKEYKNKTDFNPRDITQYRFVHNLFEAIQPFVCNDPSYLKTKIFSFAEYGEGEIPVTTDKWTVFIPKTQDASIIFNEYTSWCNANPNGSSYFHYKENYRKPNNDFSDYYIIINNDLFENKSNELYQIHFESDQIKSGKNESGYNVDIYNLVFKNSPLILNYFHNELLKLIKLELNVNNSYYKLMRSSKYLKFLLEFNGSEYLNKIFNPDITILHIQSNKMSELKNLNYFKNLEFLIITDTMIYDIDSSIGELDKLSILLLNNNQNLKLLPDEIGNLKNLEFINIYDTAISKLPQTIKYLDKSNGGKLEKIKLNSLILNSFELNNVKKLLPNVNIE